MELTVIVLAGATCLASGALPWINAELTLLGAAAIVPPAGLPALLGACAAGQVLGKCGVYAIARWAPHRLPSRATRMIDRIERFRDRGPLIGGAVFTGALATIPPFYLVTLACGVLRVPLALFAAAGFAGTAARYGLILKAAASLGLSP
jgi:membrane protein YqaA with SNARE-associated domain